MKTIDHKYNEPGTLDKNTAYQDNEAFVRLLSLFNDDFDSSNGGDVIVHDVMMMSPVENSSASMYWYEELLFRSDTSMGPCSSDGLYNMTCNSNLTELAADGQIGTPYSMWQVHRLLKLLHCVQGLLSLPGLVSDPKYFRSLAANIELK